MARINLTKNIDPLLNIKPAIGNTIAYKVSYWWLSFKIILYIVPLLVGISISIKELDYLAIGFVLLMIVVLSLDLFYTVIGINCTEKKIEIKFLVAKSKRLNLKDITALDIKVQRGQWCYIKTESLKRWFPVFSFKESPQMIKTIVSRASLVFIESDYNKAIFQRKQGLL